MLQKLFRGLPKMRPGASLGLQAVLVALIGVLQDIKGVTPDLKFLGFLALGLGVLLVHSIGSVSEGPKS